MRHANGHSATVLYHGAHIVAWRDTRGENLLFLSKSSKFEEGVPIRGGIPIVFPQFAKDGAMPLSHGFARIFKWDLRSTSIAEDGTVMISFGLHSNPETERYWPSISFDAELEVSLAHTLACVFRVRNEGAQEFAFANAFHNYFAISDIGSVDVEGLFGLSGIDKTRGNTLFVEDRSPREVAEATDSIYLSAPPRLVLNDRLAGRRIFLEKQNLSDAVVWNPWVEGARMIGDLADDEYRTMLCVESGNIYQNHKILLQPGESIACRQELSYEMTESAIMSS